MFLLFFIFFCGAALRVLHVADFHLDVDYSIYGDKRHMCHNSSSPMKTRLGRFGDYMCDAPKPLVVHAIEEAKRVLPDPDLVIWTGDNVPHVDKYSFEYVLNAVNMTTNLLRSRYPNQTILPTFGNHDYAPANAFISSSPLYAETWKIWKGLINESEKERFLKGGYYKHHLANATILMLNTNLYYNSNGAYLNFTDKNDPAGQFAFLESELRSAMSCQKNESSRCTSVVHVVAHIAPGVFERSPNWTWFRDQYNEKFLHLITKYADVVGMMLFGHHHTDTFHLIKDSSGTTVQFALMAPAVTPWFSSLKGAGANNPAFRVYDVAINGVFNDIVTYYVNLSTLNKQQNTPFTVEYSFKEAYDINGTIDVEAMNDLMKRLKTNKTLFEKYIKYNSVMWNPEMPVGLFRGGQLCSLEFADYPRYRDCLAQYNAGPAYVNPGFLAIVVIFNYLCSFFN